MLLDGIMDVERESIIPAHHDESTPDRKTPTHTNGSGHINSHQAEEENGATFRSGSVEQRIHGELTVGLEDQLQVLNIEHGRFIGVAWDKVDEF